MSVRRWEKLKEWIKAAKDEKQAVLFGRNLLTNDIARLVLVHELTFVEDLLRQVDLIECTNPENGLSVEEQAAKILEEAEQRTEEKEHKNEN